MVDLNAFRSFIAHGYILSGIHTTGTFRSAAQQSPITFAGTPPHVLVSHMFRACALAQSSRTAPSWAQSGTRALLFDFYGGGQFSDGGIGFIGFRFNNGAGVQYGWARLRTQGHFEEGFKLLDYAWGDPGDQVRAGQTSLAGGQVEATPDHGSLGLLAIGGAGLIAWRKQRAPMCGEN